ncbi:hypothetical protein K466DRAFT_542923 [Polyporus arcularius HHB13444]|uniref:Phosphatidylglycerol/phosphatidylinositol transfer protein n=1 Tax=Polyporus arcularius HHB13444 TaxID=1314778 RepID=A0A5C3PP65_9APHY|nr:hypothetical protein K466DRAFT_542923 [Polyporus arcularius HHB13444]
MKFIIALATLAASALAQSVNIGAPADMSTVTPGNNITVQVNRPNTLTGSEEVAIVIGLFPCSGADGQPASCAETNTTGVLGTVLYNGPYKPQYADGAPSLPPHQNFSIQVPATFKSGQVSLGVAHFALVGASMMPISEFVNTTLVVQ